MLDKKSILYIVVKIFSNVFNQLMIFIAYLQTLRNNVMVVFRQTKDLYLRFFCVYCVINDLWVFMY